MNATIQFTCPLCQKQMTLPSATVGQQGKCPGCGQVVTITAGAAQMPPVNPAAQNQPVLVNPVDSPPTIPSSAPVVNPPEQVNSGDSPFAKLGQVVTGLQQHSRRTQGKKVNGWVIGGVIFGGMFLLSLIFSLSQMGNISNLRSDTSSSQSQSSSADNGRVKKGTLSSFEDHPPPVLQAVRNGNEVFELKSYMSGEDDYIASAIHQYLVYKDGQLVAVCEKFIVGKGLFEPNPDEGDVKFSYQEELTFSDESGKKRNHEGKKVGDNKYEYRHLYQFQKDFFISTNTRDIQLFQDPEFGEGYWTRKETSIIDYRGRMGDMPDSREEKTSRGAAIPVKLP